MILSQQEVLCVLARAGSAGGEEPPIVRPSENDLLHCLRAVATAPIVRKERVAAIREALNAANYRVDAGEIANKMIQRSLVDAFICQSGRGIVG